ncbi:MAG: acetyl-CoA C-acyltransferase [Candidatus Riflebacteria bacterium]|nr:acetyl-CoA C-acyltransferase [Candidatus Riflebacteria bacterium]
MDPAAVEQVILGNAVSAGLGQNPARAAGLSAGLTTNLSAFTVNMACGSGLAAVVLAAQAIRCGDATVVVAGGMESPSGAPHLLTGGRAGRKLGHLTALDAVIHDGLWCSSTNQHLACAAEFVAAEYRISRTEQDEYALESHQKACKAWEAGRFGEVTPVELPGRRGEPIAFSRDESPQADANLDALAKLQPAFMADGSITLGNAPPLGDGAAALVLMDEDRARREGRSILGRIEACASGGVEPKWAMMAPVRATRKVLEMAQIGLDRMDLIELDEAFAAQALAVSRVLKLDLGKVNVNGGSIGLGHPLGASGARILVTLIHELDARKLKTGLATLGLGGGDALAVIVERP